MSRDPQGIDPITVRPDRQRYAQPSSIRGHMHGGLRLAAHKQRSTRHPLREASAAQSHVLPLNQHIGTPSTPLVKAGERVRLGQLIAEAAGDIGARLHAPVSGMVTAVEARPAPQHLGAAALSPVLSVVIANDGRDERHEAGAPGPHRSFEQYAPEELCEHIALGGIVGLGGAAYPTAPKLQRARRPVRLLLDTVECEPYISCDDMLLREHARDVVLGARILMHALQTAHCTIALEDDTPAAEQALRRALADARDERIQVVVLPSRYPAGSERQLIEAVFSIEVPFDGLPADVGMICQNVGTAAAIARWLRDGEPLIRRIVTVTGDGVMEPANLDVRLGTPISSLIEDCGGYTARMHRLIMGGIMMGTALPHDALPIIKASHCIIAASSLDLQPRSVQMPCIRCGDCAQACPARLLPQQLHWHAQAGDLEALDRHGLMDCIECGCCDYVCPSQIPLADTFRTAKPSLRRAYDEREAAAAARARFQARNARLARLEAEHRAKLAARRPRPGGEPAP